VRPRNTHGTLGTTQGRALTCRSRGTRPELTDPLTPIPQVAIQRAKKLVARAQRRALLAMTATRICLALRTLRPMLRRIDVRLGLSFTAGNVHLGSFLGRKEPSSMEFGYSDSVGKNLRLHEFAN
jgi:hypothetical protein